MNANAPFNILYSRVYCDRVRVYWEAEFRKFLADSTRPTSEICMLSSNAFHFGRHRYIVDTSYLRF